MQLSIVIPSRSEGRTLHKTLASLQELRMQSCEIIVVEAGESSGCEHLVDIELRTSSGRSLQMNAGAARASGEYLLFLHADTVLPNGIKVFISGLSVEKSLWGFFPVRLSGAGWALRVIEWFISKRSALTGVATGDQAIVARRATFLSLGGFEALPLMEDVALSKRLRKLARPIVAVQPVVTSSRRWEQRGVVSTVVLMWALRLAYFVGVPVSRIERWYR